jgi:hypothetical protein
MKVVCDPTSRTRKIVKMVAMAVVGCNLAKDIAMLMAVRHIRSELGSIAPSRHSRISCGQSCTVSIDIDSLGER